MRRLRRILAAVLAGVVLAALPGCSTDTAKKKVDKAGQKAKSAADKAKKQAEKAKKDVNGQ
jgi:outer membrane PBP1 activator LpoA protein